MKQYGLVISDNTNESLRQKAEEEWENCRNYYEQYGVQLDDYQYATYDYSTKRSLIFEAIYGVDGERETSVSELKEFFKEHYYIFDYIEFPTINKDGAAMTNEEINELKREVDDYETSIQSGTMTLSQAANDFNERHGLVANGETGRKAVSVQRHADSDKVFSKDSSSGLYSDIAKIKQGQTSAIGIAESGNLMIVSRLKNESAVRDYFNTDSSRYYENVFSVLAAMKTDEYEQLMADAINSFDKSSLEINYEVFDCDLKQLFESN